MSLKLLFADDSVTMHKIIQLTLESEDIDLRIANDGQEALSAIGEDKPDVLIADIAMPIMNGFELCRQVKESPEMRDIPVVLLSGELEEYDAQLGATVGADAHLTKPFKSGEFIDTVRKLTLGVATAGTLAAQPEIGLVAENDLEKEAGMLYEEKADDSLAGSEQETLLELTEAQPTEAGSASLPDVEFDEEFEVVNDDIQIDDSLDDDDDDDLLSDGLDIEGVDMELEGLEEIAAQTSEEEPAADADSLLPNDKLVDDDLDSAFKGLSGDVEAEVETAVPADEPEQPEKVEEEAVESVIEIDEVADKPEEPIATEVEKADEILDEVFKDADIESSDELLEEAVEVVVEEATTETVEAEPEPLSQPMAEASGGSEVPPLSQEEITDAVRDSVKKSLSEFMETKAADIFREELSKSIDERLKSFMESRLEAIVKEELHSAIGKRVESAMPEIVAAAARITSEVTPGIAEELIKQTIEQIKKGDVS